MNYADGYSRHGGYMRFCLAVTSAWVALAMTGFTAQRTVSDERTEIVGSKNPELVPEWLRWEMFLSRTDQIVILARDMAPQVLNRTLLLPSLEISELRKEGELQKLRRKQLDESTRQFLDSFDRNGLTPDQVLRALHDGSFALELRYRTDVLEARDTILSRVVPESALAIDQWIREMLVPRVRLFLHPLDVDRFGLPR